MSSKQNKMKQKVEINPVPEDFKPLLQWLQELENRINRIEAKLKGRQNTRKRRWKHGKETK